MRYIVTFTDRTSRRLDENAAKVFMEAMRSKEPVFFKGCMYAPYAILSVKPLHSHEEELRDEARQHGLFRCGYGRIHAASVDCACRDAGYQKTLEEPEEKLLEKPSERTWKANADFLGITQAKEFHETPSNWTKVGDMQ